MISAQNSESASAVQHYMAATPGPVKNATCLDRIYATQLNINSVHKWSRAAAFLFQKGQAFRQNAILALRSNGRYKAVSIASYLRQNCEASVCC
jgi:hypothetical protein